MKLHSVELTVLTACQEILKEKTKLMNQLAKTLGIDTQDLFYQWISGKLPQHGFLSGRQWKYFFHGFECDFRHILDGRLIRIEFGPGGRIDTFTDWGIYKFITTVRKQWLTTPAVLTYFSTISASLPSALLDDYQKISFIITQLKSKQWVVAVAPELAKINGNPIRAVGSNDLLIQLPKFLTDYKYLDTRVCQRLIISATGKKILALPRAESAVISTLETVY